MRKVTILVLSLVFCALSYAEHSHHSYVGSHGMAVIKLPDGSLLAHHLPLYSNPHDYQIIYRISLDDDIRQSILALDFVTILPKAFDLNRLIQGERFSINAKVFNGHFERGGKAVVSTQINFEYPIYRRHLTLDKAADRNTEFDIVNADNNALAIHKIVSKPSFDAIVLLQSPYSLKNKMCSGVDPRTINRQSIGELVQTCFAEQPTYIEFKDFR